MNYQKTNMMSWRKKIGLLRSKIIYDFKPFNRVRLKRFYSQFVGNNSLCFDLGAHTGNRSAAWLALGAKVVAAEPQPLFCKLLENKFSSNPGFYLIPKAIGEKNKTAKLSISLLHPTVSTLSQEWQDTIQKEAPSTKWDEHIMVEVITLDNIIAEYGIPDFCKIDVEGLEEEVLKGTDVALPLLSFEFFPTTMSQTFRCIDRLCSLGEYEFNWSLTESLQLNSKKWMSADEMKTKLNDYDGKKSGDVYARLKNKN